ncbi:MAG TPA: deoxyribose-phosphate aldolase [Terracidiphilus sp.]|nr:deoxyribose-phosphate aldolase [Terracidiphilus sp.]
MSATIAIQNSDLDFDHGTFDSAAFAAKALADWRSLAAVIDHSLVKAEATRPQVEAMCAEAARYRFASVVVNPVWASTAVRLLEGTDIPVAATIGFPLGASLVSTLRHEAAALIRLGARELGMVLPIGQLKSGNHHGVEHAIHAVAKVAHDRGAILKVNLETCLLTMQEKLRASEIAIHAGADFINTATGFASGGATPGDVALMRGVVGARCGVKAAGRIRTVEQVRALLEAGANRIGSSASVAIVRELGAE